MLDQPGGIEFRIFTLIGEEVYSRVLNSGQAGTEAGQEHFLEWDGRNDAGKTVLNGVYLAWLRHVETGRETKLKIAVVKR